MNLDDPIAQIKLASSICTSVAILATLIRLFVKRSVFRFDDVCALISMLCAIVQLGIIVSTQSSPFPAYYDIISSMFYSTVWFSRLSILLSIIRIGPKKESRPLFAVVVLFLILLGVLIGQMYWVCEPQQTSSNIICTSINQIAIFKLVSDVIADLVLLTSSLRLFLLIQDKALRFRLSCLFSTCIVTTVLSLVNCSFILGSEGLKVIIVAVVEANTSLIVANVPVLFSLVLQVGDPHTSHGANGEGVTSIVHFVRDTDTQLSETSSIETGPMPLTMIKTSSVPLDVIT